MTAVAVMLGEPDARDVGVRRYFGLGTFALLSGHPYRQLIGWRHSERIWVPSPDIEIGRWPGWSLACIRAYSPDGPPFLRPNMVSFADTTEAMHYYGTSRKTLWACVSDHTIPGPVVWIDDRAGWLLR
ncbi:hypothetical protein ACFVMC_00180 [Nocardia sp. NPDC127579]|uniref:hypothetical protein n=1 Tax=Nocardia sp. NPDC127579 TaxID=3345402 RepID=UPI00363F650D